MGPRNTGDHLVVDGRRTADLAYEKLADAVVSLQLAPGLVVNEKTLAEHLGVKRLTLVAALHRLSETGLVTILPRRGIVISPVDVLEAQQVFDARLALEGKGAELAAQRATVEEVAQIEELVSRLDNVAASTQDYRAFLLPDQQLHLALARLSRNRFVVQALERVLKVNLRLWHLFFKERGDLRPYALKHDRIVAAIRARDTEAARKAISDHIVESRELLQSGLWG
jgi:GntR family transcriptional regulator, rspAB operon transcriptional repressor